MMRSTRLQLLSCVVLSLAILEPANAQGLTLDDLGKISGVSSPRMSPDGESVVVVVSTANYEENRYENRLVIVYAKSGDTRDLTFERHSVSRPRWSPSGDHLAFIAKQGDGEDATRQVFALPIQGGEARAVTSAPLGVAAFEWSGDGNEVIYVAADAPAEKPEGPERHNKSFVVTHHDYLASQRPPDHHVWRASIDDDDVSRISNKGVLAAAGPLSWLSVSLDGSAAVFTGFPAEHPGDFREMGLYVIDLETGEQRSFDGALHPSLWGDVSPDGLKIAQSSPKNGVLGYTSHHIAVGDARGGPTERLTKTLDRSFWGAMWMRDSNGLLVGARDAARNTIWYQPLSGDPQKLQLGDLEPATGYGPAAMDANDDGAIAFVATKSDHPTELYWMDSIDSQPRRLTNFNAEVGALDLGASEEIAWETEGFQANGILTFPPGFDDSQSYPLVLKIHGGPMSGSTLRFDELSQLLASKGFVVFAPNYRGSDNLGEEYQAAIIHDAGAGPGRDIMAGIEAVKDMGFVDESRIGVSGWSYGGYMTSWLIGNYPDVWRAAMAGAPVTDYVDSYALADLNKFFGYGFDKHPWSPEGQAEWREQSPIAYAHQATTPTLIMCNTGDLRVPITESYKLFHALNDHDVPVQFVAYPIPGHSAGDPVHRRDVRKRWMDWMEQRFEVPRDAPVSQ